MKICNIRLLIIKIGNESSNSSSPLKKYNGRGVNVNEDKIHEFFCQLQCYFPCK